MNIRSFRSGDEQEILSLFRVVFCRELDEKLWRWYYLENPMGESVITLCFDGETLVGHYAVTPAILYHGGNEHHAAFSMTTMTHPDYAGRGIFTKLAKEAYDRCESVGIKAIYGFPNTNSYDGFTRKLGWQGFGQVPTLEIDGLPKKYDKQAPLPTILHAKKSPSTDSLWKKAIYPKKVVVPRTREYFEWRYFRKPGAEYTVFSFEDADGALVGVIVLKLHVQDSAVTGHIVDFLAIDDNDVRKSMLSEAFDFFGESGTTRISTWLPGKRPEAECLLEAGFHVGQWPTYFGAKPLGPPSEFAATVTDLENWDITMGDSDVF